MGNSSSAQGLGGETQGVKVTVKERYHAYLPKHINLNAVLTAEKVRLIHAHWTFIADERNAGIVDNESRVRQSRISVFYDAFYEKLFELAPGARKLFDGNMVRQSRALVKMVSWLCNLEATDDLVSRLEALADRHVEYNCLPSHYEAGGVALMHALITATRDQNVEERKVFMKAWEDIYSFVILIVIPRTALRLEEQIRTSGPVSTMLRPAPNCGTRLKAHMALPEVKSKKPPYPRATGSSGGGHGGFSGSPRSAVGTPPTAVGSPDADEKETFSSGETEAGAASSDGGGSRRLGRSASRNVLARSGLSLTRNTGGVPRSRSRGRSSDSGDACEKLSDVDAGVRCGGSEGNARGSARTSGPHGSFTPGDSPSSVASSGFSGMRSIHGSVTNTTGSDFVCASPDGSTASAKSRRKGEHRRRLKILNGLRRRARAGADIGGRVWIYGHGNGRGGGGGNAGSAAAGSNSCPSPRDSFLSRTSGNSGECIRSRALSAFSLARQDGSSRSVDHERTTARDEGRGVGISSAGSTVPISVPCGRENARSSGSLEGTDPVPPNRGDVGDPVVVVGGGARTMANGPSSDARETSTIGCESVAATGSMSKAVVDERPDKRCDTGSRGESLNHAASERIREDRRAGNPVIRRSSSGGYPQTIRRKKSIGHDRETPLSSPMHSTNPCLKSFQEAPSTPTESPGAIRTRATGSHQNIDQSVMKKSPTKPSSMLSALPDLRPGCPDKKDGRPRSQQLGNRTMRKRRGEKTSNVGVDIGECGGNNLIMSTHDERSLSLLTTLGAAEEDHLTIADPSSLPTIPASTAATYVSTVARVSSSFSPSSRAPPLHSPHHLAGSGGRGRRGSRGTKSVKSLQPSTSFKASRDKPRATAVDDASGNRVGGRDTREHDGRRRSRGDTGSTSATHGMHREGGRLPDTALGKPAMHSTIPAREQGEGEPSFIKDEGRGDRPSKKKEAAALAKRPDASDVSTWAWSRRESQSKPRSKSQSPSPRASANEEGNRARAKQLNHLVVSRRGHVTGGSGRERHLRAEYVPELNVAKDRARQSAGHRSGVSSWDKDSIVREPQLHRQARNGTRRPQSEAFEISGSTVRSPHGGGGDGGGDGGKGAGKGEHRDSARDRDKNHADRSRQLVRTMSQETAKRLGFLEEGTVTPRDRRSWADRPGNSSGGGEADQLRAHALAYRDSQNRDRHKQNKRSAKGSVGGVKEGGEILPTRRQMLREQQRQMQERQMQERQKRDLEQQEKNRIKHRRRYGRQASVDSLDTRRTREDKPVRVSDDDLSFSTPVKRRGRLALGGARDSPTPEQLAAVAAKAMDVRRVQKERTMSQERQSPVARSTPRRSSGAVMSTASPIHKDRSLKSSDTTASSPPVVASPFFAASAPKSITKPTSTATLDGGDLVDDGSNDDYGDADRCDGGSSSIDKRPTREIATVGHHTWVYGGGGSSVPDETPPMWKPRRPITGARDAPSKPLACSDNDMPRGDDSGGGGGDASCTPCGGGQLETSAPSTVRLARRPSTPARQRESERRRKESMQRNDIGSSTTDAPSLTGADIASSDNVDRIVEQDADVVEGTANHKEDGGRATVTRKGEEKEAECGRVGRDRTATAVLAAVLAAGVIANTPPDPAALSIIEGIQTSLPSPFVTDSPRLRSRSPSPPSRPQPGHVPEASAHTHETTPQQHQEQQQEVQVVKTSSKTPMSLPPADDSEDTLEPDRFGGTTPIAKNLGKKARGHVRNAGNDGSGKHGGSGDNVDGGNCSVGDSNSSNSSSSSIGGSPVVGVSAMRRHSATSPSSVSWSSSYWPSTPALTSRGGLSLPRRLDSLTSLWSGSDFSRDSRGGGEEELNDEREAAVFRLDFPLEEIAQFEPFERAGHSARQLDAPTAPIAEELSGDADTPNPLAEEATVGAISAAEVLAETTAATTATDATPTTPTRTVTTARREVVGSLSHVSELSASGAAPISEYHVPPTTVVVPTAATSTTSDSFELPSLQAQQPSPRAKASSGLPSPVSSASSLFAAQSAAPLPDDNQQQSASGPSSPRGDRVASISASFMAAEGGDTPTRAVAEKTTRDREIISSSVETRVRVSRDRGAGDSVSDELVQGAGIIDRITSAAVGEGTGTRGRRARGPTDGLVFGNVRQKASLWGKAVKG